MTSQLLQNSILQRTEINGDEKRISWDRILKIHPSGKSAIAIRWGTSDPSGKFLEDVSAMPREIDLISLDDDVSSGRVEILRCSPCVPSHRLQYNVRQITLRNRAWSTIEELIANPDIFNSARRTQLVEEGKRKHHRAKQAIYRDLRRYWQGGQTQDSLIPRFDRCGGKSQRRPGKGDGKKRGRPCRIQLDQSKPIGVNITEKLRQILQDGYKTYYMSRKCRTLKAAFELTIRSNFAKNYYLRDGIPTPQLPPLEDLPSFDQFVYHCHRTRDCKQTIIAREGDRMYRLKKREILGESTSMGSGPGSLFQMDATIADLNLVSSLHRGRTIGRPVLYLIVDVFSRLIVGYNLTVENPSYIAAMMAIVNLAEDKVAICKSNGITISEEQWPSQQLPEYLLVDRGPELIGSSGDYLKTALNITIQYTSPYRADMKGIIETRFNMVNGSVIHWLPGAVVGQHTRGERDPSLDAVLTLHELRPIILKYILAHNSHLLKDYELDKEMIADGVQPIPIELWRWGIKNRSGPLRSIDPNELQLKLLPLSKASVTESGIIFKKVSYSCERALKEQWFLHARHKRWQVDVSYDPRNIDRVYLRLGNGAIMEPVQLLNPADRFAGLDLAETEHFFLEQNIKNKIAEGREVQARAELDTFVDAKVAKARGLTKVAQQGERASKRTENKREFRLIERDADRNPIQNNSPQPIGSPAIVEVSATCTPSSGQYIALPSNSAALRELREKRCKNG